MFRRLYPQGTNYLVASDVQRSTTRKFGQVNVRFVDLATLTDDLAS